MHVSCKKKEVGLESNLQLVHVRVRVYIGGVCCRIAGSLRMACTSIFAILALCYVTATFGQSGKTSV